MSKQCSSVSQTCPVSATLYGYRPILGVNSFLAALFGTLLIAHIVIGTWKRSWTFMIAISIGCFGELMGYIGRLLLHTNPWSETGLEIEICCLVLAPSFLAAGVYLTLKHVVIYCGEEYSRLRPARYPWIFILCDLGSIAIQAIGGGIAASAKQGSSRALLNAGDDLIIAGIAFQVGTMAVFLALALDYYLRRKKALLKVWEGGNAAATLNHSPERYMAGTRRSHQFHFFCFAISFAYVTILIRCIYRIHEMAGGWGNSRMRDETVFLILDGMMVAFASIAFTLAHPAFMFPPMCKRKRSMASK